MSTLIFNQGGNYLLQTALLSLSKDIWAEQRSLTSAGEFISCIYVIELARFSSLYELTRYLIRIEMKEPSASVLLIRSADQLIPGLLTESVSISASLTVWIKELLVLQISPSNIKHVIEQCFVFLNHTLISDRKAKIIRCLASGMSVDEIARTVFLSSKTVYTYISLTSVRYGFSTSKKFHRYLLSEYRELKNSAGLPVDSPLNGYNLYELIKTGTHNTARTALVAASNPE